MTYRGLHKIMIFDASPKEHAKLLDMKNHHATTFTLYGEADQSGPAAA